MVQVLLKVVEFKDMSWKMNKLFPKGANEKREENNST